MFLLTKNVSKGLKSKQIIDQFMLNLLSRSSWPIQARLPLLIKFSYINPSLFGLTNVDLKDLISNRTEQEFEVVLD